MKKFSAFFGLFLMLGSTFVLVLAQEREVPNRLIDFPAFMKISQEVYPYRKGRRVTEKQFIEMAKDKDTIILDTRSRAKFELLHVKNAVHLNFSDFTKAELEKTIPSKETRVLIYCNNNFENEPIAFPSKSLPTALNIPTFINLYSYGYKNIYELGPVIDPAKSKLEYEKGAL